MTTTELALNKQELLILGLSDGWMNRSAHDALEEAAKREALRIIAMDARQPFRPMRAYPFVPRINEAALRVFMDGLEARLVQAGITPPSPRY